MGVAVGSLVAQYGGDTSGLAKAVAQAVKMAEQAEKAMEQAGRASDAAAAGLDHAGDASGRAADGLKAAAAAAGDVEKRAEAAARAVASLSKTMGGATSTAARFAELGGGKMATAPPAASAPLFPKKGGLSNSRLGRLQSGDAAAADAAAAKAADAASAATPAKGPDVGALAAVGTIAAGVAYSLGRIGAAGVQAASDVEETRSAMAVAFGSGAEAAEQWATTTADSMGRSVQQLRGGATQLQAIFNGIMGSTDAARAKSVEMSTSLAGLSVDLGSFFNASDADALAALRSAMVGQAEPMLRFGVAMNQASLEAFMLEKGIKGNLQTMSEADKVALRFAFVMEKTQQAQGDAAATADSHANSMKRLDASSSAASVAIGQALTPAVDAVGRAINAALEWFNGLDESTQTVIVTVGVAVGVIAGLTAGAVALAAVLPAIAAGFELIGLTSLSALWPILGTVAAVVAAVAGIALAIGAVRMAWKEDLGGMRSAFEAAWKWITDSWRRSLQGWIDAYETLRLTAAKVALDAIRGFREMGKAAQAVGLFTGTDFDGMALNALRYLQGAVKASDPQKIADTWKGWIDDAAAATSEIGTSLKDGIVDALKASADSFKEIFASAAGDAVDGVAKRAEGASRAAGAADRALAGVTGGEKKEKVQKSKGDQWSGAIGMLDTSVKTGVRRVATQLETAMNYTGDLIATTFKNAGGLLGQTINAAIAGFAQGGWIGAVAAVAVTLIAGSEGLKGLFELLNQILGSLANMLGKLLEPLLPIIAVVADIVDVLITALEPIFQVLAVILEPISAILMVVAQVFAALAPVIAILLQVLIALNPGFQILALVLRALFPVVKWLGVILIWFTKAVGTIWNAIVRAVYWVLDKIVSALEWALPDKAVRGFRDFANEVNSWQVDIGELTDAQNTLANTTLDSAAAQAEAAVATRLNADATEAAATKMDGAAKAAQKIGESLTNVPEGFKVRAAQFAAQEAVGSVPHFAEGGYARRPTLAVVGDSPGGEYMIPASKMQQGGGGSIQITIQGDANPEATARAVQRILRREGFLGSGSIVPTAPAFAGSRG